MFIFFFLTNRMKPSLIFCNQFVEKHGEKHGEKIEFKEDINVSSDKAISNEVPKKRRGRKPGIKKEEPVNTFKIENREIIIDFS